MGNQICTVSRCPICSLKYFKEEEEEKIEEIKLDDSVIPVDDQQPKIPDRQRTQRPSGRAPSTAGTGMFRLASAKPRQTNDSGSAEVTTTLSVSDPPTKTKSDSPTNTKSTLTKAKSTTPSLYSAASTIDSKQFDINEKKILDDPKGMYLVYDQRNGGSWMLIWSKEFVQDAWAFSKPKEISSVPEYRFNPSQKTQLAAGIHSSKESMGQGWIEFLKNARRFHGNLVLLSEYGKQVGTNVFEIVTIGLRNEATQEVLLADGSNTSVDNLDQYDSAVAVIGTGRVIQLLLELTRPGKKVFINDFISLGKSCGSGTSFV